MSEVPSIFQKRSKPPRVRNRKYTKDEKIRILREAIVYIKKDYPLTDVAALVEVPFNTFYLWIRRLREEGHDSLENQVEVIAQQGQQELQQALEWLSSMGVRPTPKGFKRAVRNLKLSRRASSLYVRYRNEIKIAKEKL